MKDTSYKKNKLIFDPALHINRSLIEVILAICRFQLNVIMF